MKIILCCGSYGSAYDQVWGLLRSAGVAEASSPDGSGLDIRQWYDKLLPEGQSGVDENPLGAINPGKLWERSILSLLQGNLANPVWGWADSRSIRLLEFWKGLEPEVRFVLTYSRPEQAIARSLLKNDFPNEGQAAVDHWLSYNTRLLQFYNRNKNRALLVDSQVVMEEPADFISRCNDEFSLSLTAGTGMTDHGDTLANSIGNVLARSMLRARDEVEALLWDLDASATLAGNSDPEGAVDDAWRQYRVMLQAFTESKQHQRDLAESKSDGERAIRDFNEQKKELTSEKEFLVLEVNQVQEELERYYQLYQKCQSSLQDRLDEESAAEVVRKEQQESWLSMQKEAKSWGFSLDMECADSGVGWYGPEVDRDGVFRWTGPEASTVIKLPIDGSDYRMLVVGYKDTLTAEQLAGLSFEVNGKKHPHSIVNLPHTKYLVVVLGRQGGGAGQEVSLAIHLPQTIPPSSIDRGNIDDRKLGIRINSIYALRECPTLDRLACMPKMLTSALKRSLKQYHLSVEGFPVTHFDGVGYLLDHPDVAEQVRKKQVSCALQHYLVSGVKSGYAFPVAVVRVPSLGDEFDITRYDLESATKQE